jgi:pseudoazurin
MHMGIKLAATAILAGMTLINVASAAEFTVNMVNKDADGRAMQFEPAFLKVAPGDVVHFVAVDKGHDTESILIPDGADDWKSKLSQNIDVTFDTEGLYAYKCAPHFGLGMVGLIQVGDAPSNVDAVKALKMPSKATARMGELLAEAGL